MRQGTVLAHRCRSLTPSRIRGFRQNRGSVRRNGQGYVWGASEARTGTARSQHRRNLLYRALLPSSLMPWKMNSGQNCLAAFLGTASSHHRALSWLERRKFTFGVRLGTASDSAVSAQARNAFRPRQNGFRRWWCWRYWQRWPVFLRQQVRMASIRGTPCGEKISAVLSAPSPETV